LLLVQSAIRNSQSLISLFRMPLLEMIAKESAWWLGFHLRIKTRIKMREVSRSVYLISIYNSILRYHSSQPDETVNSKDHKSEYEKVHLCFPHRQASLSVIYRARTEAISGTPGHRRCREDKTKSVLPKITKSRPLSDFGVSHWV